MVRALRRDLRAATRRATAPEAAPPLLAATGTPVANTLGPGVLDAGQSALPPGERFALRDPLLIGRGSTNDITLDDDWVSAQHVRLRRQNGAWLAEDLGSTNGTRVNGRPLERRRARACRRRAGPRPRQAQAGGAQSMIRGDATPRRATVVAVRRHATCPGRAAHDGRDTPATASRTLPDRSRRLCSKDSVAGP